MIVSVTVGVGDDAEAVSEVISVYALDASGSTEYLAVRIEGDESDTG